MIIKDDIFARWRIARHKVNYVRHSAFMSKHWDDPRFAREFARRSPVPHPDSPAGRTFDWSAVGLPHPNSPAGRTFDWSVTGLPHPDSPAGRRDWGSALLHNTNNEHEVPSRQIEEFERFLAKQSAIFRENLPDASLQDIYDLRTDRTKSSGFGRSIEHVAHGTAHHLNSLFLTLENQIQWVDANSHDLPRRSEFLILLGTRHMALEHGTVAEKREFWNRVRGFAKRFYEAATKNIQKQWAEAKRSGKQEELLERWKMQTLQAHLTRSSSGTGQNQSKVEEYQQSTARAERRPDPPTRTPTVVKTWIEFQLIDEDGDPVPNVTYRVKLPNGSTRDGLLDDEGLVRFDNIDPGQCQVTFPAIDADAWHPI
jgi:hypothetical protein